MKVEAGGGAVEGVENVPRSDDGGAGLLMSHSVREGEGLRKEEKKAEREREKMLERVVGQKEEEERREREEREAEEREIREREAEEQKKIDEQVTPLTFPPKILPETKYFGREWMFSSASDDDPRVSRLRSGTWPKRMYHRSSQSRAVYSVVVPPRKVQSSETASKALLHRLM